MAIHIHPSILSADFVNFERDFLTVSSADAIHVDVMDGHFVPNLTFGLPMVKRMAEVSPLPLDVHLMIENADDHAVAYALAGATSVTFHVEASTNPISLSSRIRESGASSGIALRPGTDLDVVLDSLDSYDMVLIMTVEPGFGGQKFMDEMMPKVAAARAEVSRLGLSTVIQVDGGIDENTIITAAKAGANNFVSGSAVFSKSDRAQEINMLRNLASEFYCA